MNTQVHAKLLGANPIRLDAPHNIFGGSPVQDGVTWQLWEMRDPNSIYFAFVCPLPALVAQPEALMVHLNRTTGRVTTNPSINSITLNANAGSFVMMNLIGRGRKVQEFRGLSAMLTVYEQEGFIAQMVRPSVARGL